MFDTLAVFVKIFFRKNISKEKSEEDNDDIKSTSMVCSVNTVI